jgi:hypothetical protein
MTTKIVTAPIFHVFAIGLISVLFTALLSVITLRFALNLPPEHYAPTIHGGVVIVAPADSFGVALRVARSIAGEISHAQLIIMRSFINDIYFVSYQFQPLAQLMCYSL